MSDVKRYTSYDIMMTLYDHQPLPSPDGAWVKHDDYAALQARVAELEALVKDDEEQAKWVEGLAVVWIAAEARAKAAEALLSEAVKAGMVEGAKVCDCRDREKDDSMYLVGCIDASQANAKRISVLADDPETIARIVAQLKEGRG